MERARAAEREIEGSRLRSEDEIRTLIELRIKYARQLRMNKLMAEELEQVKGLSR